MKQHWAVIAAFLVLWIGGGVALYLVGHDADTQTRRGEYKICVRQMEVRSGMNIQLGDHFVILNCTPDLHGGLATLLTSAETKSYQCLVARDNLPMKWWCK